MRKKDKCKTVKDVIERNTGMKAADFVKTNKEYYIQNLDKAADMLLDALNNDRHIFVMADYDVDGVTSGCIFEILFRKMRHKNYTIRFPKRFSEGYGIRSSVIDEIPQEDSPLLITVDNGITALEPIKKAKDRGCNVIIIDHHLPIINDKEMQLPCADVIVNPHATGGCTWTDYCGAGLAYRVCSSLLSPFSKDSKIMMGFAAMGTIADLMPLKEENRKIVIEGLVNLRLNKEYRTVGTEALLGMFKMDRYLTESDVAFYIAPAINAMSRMNDDGAKSAFQTLVYDGDRQQAVKMAQKMYDTNQERKQITAECKQDILAYINESGLDTMTPLCVYRENIPEGIIGLLAGELAECYHRPVLVFSDCMEIPGAYKGSARSYGGINLHAILTDCDPLFLNWGGHTEAAGMTIQSEKFHLLQTAAQESFKKRGYSISPEEKTYDLEINMDELPNVLFEINRFRPYGSGNPEICLKVKDFKLNFCSWAKGEFKFLGNTNSHVKFFGKYVDVIAYNKGEKFRELGCPLQMDIYCTAEKNYYVNKMDKLIIKDQLMCLDFDKN